MLSGREIIKLSINQLKGNWMRFCLLSILVSMVDIAIVLLISKKDFFIVGISLSVVSVYLYSMMVTAASKVANNEKFKIRDVVNSIKTFFKMYLFFILILIIIFIFKVIVVTLSTFLFAFILGFDRIEELLIICMLVVVFVFIALIQLYFMSKYTFAPYILINSYEKIGTFKSMSYSRELTANLTGKIVKLFISLILLGIIAIFTALIVSFELKCDIAFYIIIVIFFMFAKPYLFTWIANLFYGAIWLKEDIAREFGIMCSENENNFGNIKRDISVNDGVNNIDDEIDNTTNNITDDEMDDNTNNAPNDNVDDEIDDTTNNTTTNDNMDSI